MYAPLPPAPAPRTPHPARTLALWVLLAAVLAVGLVPVSAGTSQAARPTADPLSRDGLLVGAGATPPPAVTAQAWLVADADTGEVLAAQNPSEPLAMASTLKLLTALALAPGLDPATLYTATDAAAGADGSKVGLVPGSVYTVDDLLHGLMLSSGNDAAAALAEVAGGLDAAVEAMQEEADSLGADATVVRNTSGLDAPGQVSTARDLAVIGRAALDEPWLVELTTTRTYDFPGRGTTLDGTRERFQIGNKNGLLGTYEGVLGLKTGYTEASRHSFVGAATRDGHRFVVAVLKAEGRPWRIGGDLLDWAFAQQGLVEPVAYLPDTSPAADPAPSTAATGQSSAVVAAAPTAAGIAAAGGLPGWLAVPLTVLAVLVAAVVALRTRVLLRRRARRRARARHRQQTA